MKVRYNPPPNWPKPPAGWSPPPGWQPDPSWGPAPPGWRVWVPDPPSYPPTPQGMPDWRPGLGTRNSGTTMVAVAAASCGLAGFVPPLWAARQRQDATFRTRMYAVAGGLLALETTGIVLTSVAGEDVNGTPTGVAGDMGAVLLLINFVLAVTVAVLVRNPGPDTAVKAPLPGVAEELERRRLREEYRALARTDPPRARTLRVGRPDLPRNLDDGGLLDLNAVPADQLSRLAGLTPREAEQVEEVRQRLGRLSSLEELAAYADLSDVAMGELRERAVFY